MNIMKRIIIYYFSGTGNTRWVAERLQIALKMLGHKADCFSIEKVTKDVVSEQIMVADNLILAFPAYGSTAPGPMKDFINNLPSLNEKSLTLFATHAMASGDTAYHISTLLTQKGYKLKQTRHFVMPNNFHVPQFRFSKPKNGPILKKRLKKVSPQIEKLAHEIDLDIQHIVGNNPLGHILGNLQRKHIDQIIVKLSREFKINEETCLRCGKCEKICPTHNISFSQGAYVFGSDCALCLRCYSQCPVSAILIGEKSQNTKKYPRYLGPGNNFSV
jgi:ferredoxin/flavodoxin